MYNEQNNAVHLNKLGFFYNCFYYNIKKPLTNLSNLRV